ncbi:hypothetical protein DPEC_G00368520, partial [Dallia pectoralis]
MATSPAHCPWTLTGRRRRKTRRVKQMQTCLRVTTTSTRVSSSSSSSTLPHAGYSSGDWSRLRPPAQGPGELCDWLHDQRLGLGLRGGQRLIRTLQCHQLLRRVVLHRRRLRPCHGQHREYPAGLRMTRFPEDSASGTKAPAPQQPSVHRQQHELCCDAQETTGSSCI